jgi:hypothetical protein
MGERHFFAAKPTPQITAMAFKLREPGVKKSLIATLVLAGFAIGLAGQAAAETPEYIKRYWTARQTATPSEPVLKKAKERGSPPSTATNSKETPTSGDITKQEKDFKDCLDTWDKGTHMTKKEWRRTCERTITDYPELP